MAATNKNKPSTSTWVILAMIVVIIVMCFFTVHTVKKSSAQKAEIKTLSQKVSEMTKPEGQDYLSYQKLYPEVKSTLPEAWKSDSKTVYLTFDDGPSKKVTPKILKTLKKENVKATFFVVGSGTEHSLMKTIHDEGHVVAAHTYSHQYKKIYKSVDTYIEDFNKIYTLIKNETGTAPTIFRYPGGSNNVFNVLNQPQTTSEMLRRGFVPFDWNVDSGDASGTKVAKKKIVSNSVKGIGNDRVILLMHDSGTKTTTAKALPKVIKKYKKAGYTFDVLTNEDAPILFTTPDGKRYD